MKSEPDREQAKEIRDELLARELAEFGQHAIRILGDDHPNEFFILKEILLLKTNPGAVAIGDGAGIDDLFEELNKGIRNALMTGKYSYFLDLAIQLMEAQGYVERMLRLDGSNPRKWIMMAQNKLSKPSSQPPRRREIKKLALKMWAEHRLEGRKVTEPSEVELQKEIRSLKESIPSRAWSEGFDFLQLNHGKDERGAPRK